MNPNAAYWNRGVQNVPLMTGASTLMDCSDIKEHAEQLGFGLPFTNLLDVGCGTGRLSQVTSIYYCGKDISADAVAYARQHIGMRDIAGPRVARVMSGPADVVLPCGAHPFPFTWITCLSVFTHIDRYERLGYLLAFSTWWNEPELLVDIIPGDGRGDVALWTADPTQFEQDLTHSGWEIVASYDRPCPSGPMHRYYRCRRART